MQQNKTYAQKISQMLTSLLLCQKKTIFCGFLDTELSKREGSEKDEIAIRQLLQKMGFDVEKPYENFSKRDAEQVISSSSLSKRFLSFYVITVLV